MTQTTAVETRIGLQRGDHREQLDRFGTGAEDDEDRPAQRPDEPLIHHIGQFSAKVRKYKGNLGKWRRA
jgi:hypothetical protein